MDGTATMSEIRQTFRTPVRNLRRMSIQSCAHGTRRRVVTQTTLAN